VRCPDNGPDRRGARLSAALWLLLTGGRELLLLASLWLRRRAAHLRAIAGLRRALSRVRQHPPDEPLREVAQGLHEVDPGHLGAPAQSPPLPVTVLHLLGTGEILYSPLPGLKRLCAERPALACCRHLIVDTPSEPGAYLGAAAFSLRVARVVRALGPPPPGGLVLTGLSRGALTALELGSQLAIQSDAHVEVLAMSPPVRSDFGRPLTVRTIGALERGCELLLRVAGERGVLRRLTDWWLGRLYLHNTAFVLAELQMYEQETAERFAHYLSTRQPGPACLRAVREFGLLSRVSDAELRHVMGGVAERAAASPGLHLTLCWGEADVWLPAERCMQRSRDALQRGRVTPERAELRLLSRWNHGIGRQPEGDYGELAGVIWDACERAAAAAASTDGTVDGSGE
jgi:hypothetical protein